MKKSVRLYITGNFQSMFYKQFIKENAEKFSVNGFVRKLDDGRIEMFIEGDHVAVGNMVQVVKQGPKHSTMRNIEEKEEKFQDLKGFKVFNF